MKSSQLQRSNKVVTGLMVLLSVAVLAFLCYVTINPHVRHKLAAAFYSYTANSQRSSYSDTAFYTSSSGNSNDYVYSVTNPVIPSEELAASGCGCPSCCGVPSSL